MSTEESDRDRQPDRLKTFVWLGHVLIILVIHSLLVASELENKTELPPDPEKILNEALDRQQRVITEISQRSLTPEEITKFEIDDLMRDRLLKEPELIPIVEAVRNDFIAIKWKGGISTPAWKKYGVKAYPLLDYYTRSNDPIRQEYGINGIRSLGKPYTTIWLIKQIERNPSCRCDPFFEVAFKGSEFELDNPVMRDRLIELARKSGDRDDYESFNRRFLEHLESTIYMEQLNKKYQESINREPTEKEKKSESMVERWRRKYEKLVKPTAEDIKIGYETFQQFQSNDRHEIMWDYQSGRLKKGSISSFQREFLRQIAGDRKSEYRSLAIIELERHDDSVGKELISDLIDRDLSQIPELGIYFLLPLTTRYPNSRFTRGCREYGELIGRPYFSNSWDKEIEEKYGATRDKALRKPAEQKVREWQDWLSRYPDHPGADDASFRLIQAYYATNDVMSATRLWIKMLTEKVGDGDVSFRAYEYLRPLLDIGLSIQQIEILLDEPQTNPIEALLKYALAVKHARVHDYRQALEISKNLDRELERISERTIHNLRDLPWRIGSLGKEARKMLIEQRQRWQKLLVLQEQNTPESLYQIASSWANAGGYKNGYLPIWNGGRFAYIPTGTGRTENRDVCERFWVCDLNHRSTSEVREAYQLGNPNAIAVSLYQKLLEDPATPPQIREKTLFMTASTLLKQFEKFLSDENLRIHPLAGVKTSIEFWEKGYRPPNLNNPNLPQEIWAGTFSYSQNVWEKVGKEDSDYAQKVDELVKNDTKRRIAEITNELKAKFPRSVYIDDLLFAQYFLGDRKDKSYLQEIIKDYPNGDFAAEARVVLELNQN
ncbi:tetratricopeptide repeat protein [Pseudanabaena sp. PCC 6802]|uniref:tetratricopeptide repeat protein n=1 Tax=Pseudanabaena sp. PCC 6802 TaxID=118173 RepID=UPI000348AA37|nr:hypothetical protein [Pseudanabaena sp. PCC 6802]